MTNGVTRFFTLLLNFLLCSSLSGVVAGDARFNAYLKSYALMQDSIAIDDLDESLDSNFQSQNALRLIGSYFFSSASNIEAHYELQPVYFSNYNPFIESGNIGSTIAVGANQYRLRDLNPILESYGDHIVVLQNLDRLNYRHSSDAGDFTMGRQVISFGSARFINPTDIFIPFSLQTLNQEYRIGIDAIRFQAELGDFAVLDSGIIVGEDAKKENSAAFIRGKNSIAGNDIEAMAIMLDEATLLGGGIERAMGDFGFWFEAAYMFYSSENKNYFRLSTGSDYAINHDVILMLEYHFNGAGESAAEDYLNNINKQAYQKYGVFLMGEYYLIPALSWTLSPLVIFNASGFFNLNDNSIFFNLSSEVSWSDNLYSDFGLYLSAGDKFYLNADNSVISIGSEFGYYPLSAYISLLYYF